MTHHRKFLLAGIIVSFSAIIFGKAISWHYRFDACQICILQTILLFCVGLFYSLSFFLKRFQPKLSILLMSLSYPICIIGLTSAYLQFKLMEFVQEKDYLSYKDYECVSNQIKAVGFSFPIASSIVFIFLMLLSTIIIILNLRSTSQ